MLDAHQESQPDRGPLARLAELAPRSKSDAPTDEPPLEDSGEREIE